MSLDETKRPDMDESSEKDGTLPAETDAADIREDDRFSVFDNPVRPEEKSPKKRRMNKRTRTLVIALICVVVLVFNLC